MPRGSLMLEAQVPAVPGPILAFSSGDRWGLSLSVETLPGGAIKLVAIRAGEVREHLLQLSDMRRANAVRLTYVWDAPARRAHLAVERTHRRDMQLIQIADPAPLRVADLQRMFCDAGSRAISPDLMFIAVSTTPMPVGPKPTLSPETLIATPSGYRRIADLRRGDTVYTPDGEVVPVLHTTSMTVPARGSFAPMRLRSPFFGLKRDLVVSSRQRLQIRGNDVEYLFGKDAVLLPCLHLKGTRMARIEPVGAVARYHQILLPRNEPLLAAGSAVESLSIGRLARKADWHAASCLAHVMRSDLPDHGAVALPVLDSYDARVLAERRVA